MYFLRNLVNHNQLNRQKMDRFCPVFILNVMYVFFAVDSGVYTHIAHIKSDDIDVMKIFHKILK